MAVDKEVLKVRLAEAEEALHKIRLGAKRVSVKVEGQGHVEYQASDPEALELYIRRLKYQIKPYPRTLR